MNTFVEFYSGLTYSPKDIIGSDGTLVLRSSNVKKDEIVKDDNVFVKDSVVNSQNVKKGDIIVVVRNGSRSLIGKHAQIKEKMPKTVIGAFMTGIRSSEPNFVNSLLNTSAFNDEIEKNMGATINQITGGTFNSMEFKIPKRNTEQEKIGQYFKELDNLITLHHRKYSKKLQTWEQRKLFDVAEYRNGKAHENDIDEDGIYIVVNSKFVSTDGEVKKYSNKQNEPLLKNEIAFVLSDVPNGRAIAKTFLVEKSNKYTLNQRIAGITPHSDINPKFLSVTMNRNKYFLQFDDGVKQTNLSLDDMKKFEEFYPRKMEQDKIGEIFSNIDNLITLHQHQ